MVTLEDRYATATPEGVSLDAVLAGLGSRFGAFLLDFLIQGAVFIIVLIVLNIALDGGGETSSLIGEGILVLVLIFNFIGYFIICDMLWSGRSVGKRAMGIRVVQMGGMPVGFWSSLLRNVVRLIDWLPPPLYLVGSVLILSTSKNQRLGDLLGNTVVIRERQAAMTVQRGMPYNDPRQWTAPAYGPPGSPGATGYYGVPALPPELANWDVSAVTAQELMLVQTFLRNRGGYTPEARGRLALQLADRLWPMVAGPVTPPHPEHFLEAVLMVKSARG